MPYNIDKLSPETLQKIYLVLKDIKLHAEIQNRFDVVDMKWVEGIEGVPRDDHKAIMGNLLKGGIVDTAFQLDTGQCILKIDVEWFDHFMMHVKEKLAEYKLPRIQQDESFEKTTFDVDKSVLHFKGNHIRIAIQDQPTVAHGILKYVFDGNRGKLSRECFYSEIAEEEFGDTEYTKNKNGWKKYYTACKEINEKIRKNTPDRIENFLEFNTGKIARVRINPRYI